MPRDVTKTYRKEASVGRACSECGHYWSHSEEFEVSETKAGDYWEPAFDDEGLIEKLDEKIHRFENDNSICCYCPNCGALAIETINAFLPNGFLVAFRDSYTIAKKDTRNVFIFGGFTLTIIIAALLTGLDLSGFIDFLDLDTDSFFVVIGLLICTIGAAVIFILLVWAYIQNSINFFKLNSVKESDINAIDEEQAKYFFLNYTCDPFDISTIGSMIPDFINKQNTQN